MGRFKTVSAGKPEINGHVVGIVLKELVRRAIVVARRQITTFEVGIKEGYGGNMDDIYTTADSLAQASYVKSLQECFPGIGVVAEENLLAISADSKDYFTIDPLDGTRAFVRRQSHGIGSMIAMIIRGEVVSAYVGDVVSQEIYGYRPGSETVWRITDLEIYEKLPANPQASDISQLNILLREREKQYQPVSRQAIDHFKDVLIDGGSIGTWAARLWKREVGALLLAPAWETPWDSSPVIGISRKLGYIFLRPKLDGWETFSPIISDKKYYKNHDTLVIHSNNLHSLAGLIPITH